MERRFPLLAVLTPLILGVVLYVVTRTPEVLIFSLLAPLMLVADTIERSISKRRRMELRDRIAETGPNVDGFSGLNGEIETRRLKEYTQLRSEAENEIAKYLPTNPRRAKRLINHQRLYALIAEDRRIFGGSPELTHRHLAKWILLVENWPRLGSALTRDPSKIMAIEQSPTLRDLQEELDDVTSGVRASKELHQLLREGPSLSPVLARLVRFEASSSSGESRCTGSGEGEEVDDDNSEEGVSTLIAAWRQDE
jgi:hypothetical protein